MNNTENDVAGGHAPTKVTHDPGWNDPPLFSYDATTAPKRSTVLKKRVAFPLSTATTTSASSTPATVPPVTNAPPLIVSGAVPPLCSSIDTGNVVCQEKTLQIIEKEEGLKKVMDDFDAVLNAEAYDFKAKRNEIRRRLEVMRKMWEEDKLRPEIHTKMVQLAQALTDGDSKTADHIHKSLMVDYVSQCSPWMVGVRHVIHCVQSRSESSEGS